MHTSLAMPKKKMSHSVIGYKLVNQFWICKTKNSLGEIALTPNGEISDKFSVLHVSSTKPILSCHTVIIRHSWWIYRYVFSMLIEILTIVGTDFINFVLCIKTFNKHPYNVWHEALAENLHHYMMFSYSKEPFESQ